MSRPTADVIASRLLGVDSFADLCRDVLNRCLLDGGRFEAGQFGRRQHSSASAGAVLNGVATIPFVPDDLRRRAQDLGFALIAQDGSLRGHDEDLGDGTTSWSLAQVLHGVARNDQGRLVESPRYAAALSRLLALQSPEDGSWPLREGDFQDTSLAFYPALLFERLIRRQSSFAAILHSPLQRTADHMLRIAETTPERNIDATLAISALDRLAAAGFLDQDREFRYLAGKAQLASRLIDDSGTLRLSDKFISNELQPRWHSVTWTALLYACTRRWGGVRSSHNLQLAARLIGSFDLAERGWRGPSRSDGSARSWASSLALLNIYLLAQDIRAAGIDSAEYQELVTSAESRKPFDVVISFGGPDRQIAQQMRDSLVRAGFRVFFDTDYRHDLLGEDLAILLQDVYFQRSRYAIAILSRAFVESDWASNCEWKAVLARMNKQRRGYLLPYFLEDVQVPGLNPTIGYLSADAVSPTEFAEVVARKLLRNSRVSSPEDVR